MYKVAVIGGGPAGMTSALYCVRGGADVTVYEKNMFGGQMLLTNEIENYMGFGSVSGWELSENMRIQCENANINLINQEIIDINEKTFEIQTNEYKKYDAIIISTGATHRKLNVPGENKFNGLGVSYCATCDGNFFRNKIVCVIGGGNTAFEDAVYLSSICQKVYLIHRNINFKAAKIHINKAKVTKNIEIIVNANVVSINGNDKVENILLDNYKNIETNGIFISIGVIPQNDLLINKFVLDKDGYLVVNDKMQTNIKGIFGAGDIISKNTRQIATAVGDGAIAGVEALNYLNTL